MNPHDSKHLLVGGDMLGVGVSTDTGATWHATEGFSSWEINDFTWDETDPDVVWVGTLSGPYLSTNGGRTWEPKRLGLPKGDFPYSAPIQKVLVDPEDPEHVLAFGGNQRDFKAGGTGALNYGVVWESSNRGESWRRLSSVGPDVNILDVGSSATDMQTIYAVAKGRGVVRSSDGGRSWAQTVTGLPQLSARGLEIDSSDPDRAWVALEAARATNGQGYRPGGVYRTEDGGLTWSPANRGLTQVSDASWEWATSMHTVERAPDGTLYTADQGYASQKRFKSTDDGDSWQSISSSFSKFFPASGAPYVWASSRDGGLVVGGTSDTILGTTDRGRSWRDLGSTRSEAGKWSGNGFSGLLSTRVVFNPQRRNDLLVTSFDAGNVMRSDDAGRSWARPAASWDQYGGAYDVAVGGTNGEVAYAVAGQAGVYNGLLTSRNAGASWRASTASALPARWTVGSDRGSVVVASRDGSSAYAVLPNGLVYATTDTGTTWTRTYTTSPAYAAAVTPDFRTVYLATNDGVYESVDGGAFELVPGSPRKLKRLVVGPDGSLYGVGQLGWEHDTSGLWHKDRTRWKRLSSSPWVADVAVDPHDPERMLVATNDNPYHDVSAATGVWLSENGGRSFATINVGLAMTRVTTLAFDPGRPGRVVLGTNGRGFWQATLPDD